MAKFKVPLKMYFRGTGSGEVSMVVKAASKKQAAEFAEKSANANAMADYEYRAHRPAEDYVQEIT